MDTRYMKEFIVLAANGNFSDAADELYISQSSLSKHINAIENELGCSILNRTSKGMELNEAGEIFLNYATKFVALQEKLSHDLSVRRVAKENVIAIASEYQRLETVLKSFRKSHEAYTLDLHYCLSARAKSLLRSGVVELTFAYRYDLATDSELDYVPFTQENLFVACSPEHPLARLEGVEIAQLEDERFILPDIKASHTGSYINMCRHAGFEPHIAAYSGIESDMLQLVRANMGIAFIYKAPEDVTADPGYVLIPVIPERQLVGAIYYRRNAHLSQGARNLLDFVTRRYGKAFK